MSAIKIQNITKTFGKKQEVKALQNINLEVPEGSLYGLIGPDGAGKTTLFRILTTLLLPDGGEATVMGHSILENFKKIREIVGYMPGRFSLYQDLSVRENLEIFATLFNTTIEENYDLIKDIYIQLEPFSKRRAGALSGGMKQKLALCCALVHKPEILFLDEPTTGVDVVSRKEFWQMLKKLNADGITIFVSTPYMDEATMCDRIALIQEGKILSENTPKGLIESYPHQIIGVRSNEMFRLLKELENHPAVEQVYTFGEFHHVRFRKGISTAFAENVLIENQHKSFEVKKVIPTVEDCFMELMND